MNSFALFVLSLYILLPCANLCVALLGRPSRSRLLLVLFIAVTLLHNAGYFVEATAQTSDQVFVAAQFEFLFGNLSLTAFFYFLYDWCQAKLPGWFHAVFNAFAFLAAMMALTSGYHDLYFTVQSISRAKGFLGQTQPTLAYGPFEYAMYAFYLITYILMGAMIARAFRSADERKTRRTLLLFAAAGLSPMLCEILYSAGVITGIDPTPTGYFVSQSVLTWCMAREKVFDVLQNAFDLIAQRMDGALIVVDGKDKLLFSNDAANDRMPSLQNGQPLPARVARLFHDDIQNEEIRLGAGIYQSRVTVLQDGGDVYGKVALLSDVSNLHKLKEMLEQENRRITSDLELAANIQLNALPRVFPPWPERTDFDIFASMHPAKEVGGDFYDFFLVDDTRLACVIADVSGKGVPAALFMMNAKACIRDSMMAGMAPDTAFTAANNQLCAGNEAGMFVTAWAILIDLQTGEACFANAGHNPPFLRNAAGEWTMLKTRPNMVLADSFGVKYRLNRVKLSEGDQLYLYTDGVVEAQNAAGELYGEKRLVAMLAQNSGASPQLLLQAIHDDVDRFAADAPQFDDIAMLSVRMNEMMQTLTLPAALDSCAKVAAFLEEWLKKRNCPLKVTRQILVAQDEIFSNIARYAYAERPEGGEATVEVFRQGRFAVIRFIDKGVPFNPLDVNRKRRAYDDAWNEGGDGILMVKNLMDQVVYEYRDDQNRFTMKKAISSDNEIGDEAL